MVPAMVWPAPKTRNPLIPATYGSSALPGRDPLLPTVRSASPLILLQKSFWGDGRKFSEPLMRFTRREVRDHIVSSKIDHGSPPLS